MAGSSFAHTESPALRQGVHARDLLFSSSPSCLLSLSSLAFLFTLVFSSRPESTERKAPGMRALHYCHVPVTVPSACPHAGVWATGTIAVCRCGRMEAVPTGGPFSSCCLSWRNAPDRPGAPPGERTSTPRRKPGVFLVSPWARVTGQVCAHTAWWTDQPRGRTARLSSTSVVHLSGKSTQGVFLVT